MFKIVTGLKVFFLETFLKLLFCSLSLVIITMVYDESLLW